MMDKNYTIPTADISDRTDLQSTVDIEEGVYLGHVTTVTLKNGDILAAYPKSHGCGQITLKKSSDGGKTWGERLPVPDNFVTSMEVPTLFRATDKQGKSRILLFSGLYPIRMSFSEDEGNSFSPLEPIGSYGGVVAMGDMEETAPGEYIAMFHDDGRFFASHTFKRTTVYKKGEGTDTLTAYTHSFSLNGGKSYGREYRHWLKGSAEPDVGWEKVHESYSGRCNMHHAFKLYCVKSTDGGLTWGEPCVIAAPKNGEQICEPAIIRSPDGKTLVTLLRENSRRFNSFMITSDDNGDTWSGLTELPAALTGDRHTARYLPDGRLFITFRDTTRVSPTKGDWVAWIGTFDDIVSGREGEKRIRLMKDYSSGDCGYPGLEILPDGTVVTVTYGHFTEGRREPYIMCVRIPPDVLSKL